MTVSRWSLAAYGFAAAMLIGVGACMWGIPLPLTDNIVFLLEVQQVPLLDVLRERFLATNYFRPLFWAQMKVLLSLSNGHYFATFRGFHVLFGMHTFTIGLIEGPLTAIFCCVAAVALSFGDRPAAWRTAASLLLLLYAALSVELGLLVWVCYVSAYIAGSRALPGRAVALNTAVVVLYFALRFIFLPSAETGLVHRPTGVGFAIVEPETAVAAVGGRPAYLYAYNIGSSVLSVLFAEPRAGVWEFLRRYQLGEVAPWQWIHLLTSTLTSLCLLGYAAVRAPQWLRLSFTREDRLLFVFAGVLAASAVMSFAYTREAVLGPAGVLYAMSIFVVLQAWLTRMPGMHWAARLAAAVVIAAVSLGWSARAAGLTYVLRDSAFERRNDWARGVEYLEMTEHMPSDPQGRALVQAFRDDALARPVPSPRWAQPWLEEYVDRSF